MVAALIMTGAIGPLLLCVKLKRRRFDHRSHQRQNLDPVDTGPDIGISL
jgi:hypothetical protein